MTFTIPPLLRRFGQYSVSGVSTYMLDLSLIYIFKNFFFYPDWLAITLGFMIAITVNFFINYYWVYRGTKQTKLRGYLIFFTLSAIGIVVVVNGTLFIHATLPVSLYVARSIMATIVGTTNFLINTFFNFKMVD